MHQFIDYFRFSLRILFRFFFIIHLGKINDSIRTFCFNKIENYQITHTV